MDIFECPLLWLAIHDDHPGEHNSADAHDPWSDIRFTAGCAGLGDTIELATFGRQRRECPMWHPRLRTVLPRSWQSRSFDNFDRQYLGCHPTSAGANSGDALLENPWISGLPAAVCICLKFFAILCPLPIMPLLHLWLATLSSLHYMGLPGFWRHAATVPCHMCRLPICRESGNCSTICNDDRSQRHTSQRVEAESYALLATTTRQFAADDQDKL